MPRGGRPARRRGPHPPTERTGRTARSPEPSRAAAPGTGTSARPLRASRRRTPPRHRSPPGSTGRERGLGRHRGAVRDGRSQTFHHASPRACRPDRHRLDARPRHRRRPRTGANNRPRGPGLRLPSCHPVLSAAGLLAGVAAGEPRQVAAAEVQVVEAAQLAQRAGVADLLDDPGAQPATGRGPRAFRRLSDGRRQERPEQQGRDRGRHVRGRATAPTRAS
jgi:hypothetical protein